MSSQATGRGKALGAAVGAVATLTLAGGVAAEDMTQAVADRPNLNFYGVTGVIDTPTALSQPDGQLSVTVAHFAGITRNTLTFQILPRVEGSFRYAKLKGLDFSGFPTYYDRSFDVSLRILDESRYLPGVKIGLQDFVGTGLYSGEYVVATKTFGDRLTVSGGLGWGRLGSYKPVGSPFGDRPADQIGQGGKANFGQWFRGPAAPFGGITFKANDKLTFMAEYSSDAYTLETGNDARPSSALFERKSPLNFGLDYKINNAANIGVYYMYGTTLGVNLNVSLNPNAPPAKGSRGPAPAPVFVRPARAKDPAAWAAEWAQDQGANARLLKALSRQLKPQEIVVDSLAAQADTVVVRVRSDKFDNGAQMLGRVMRALTAVMPASVETFRIVPVSNGLAISTVTVRRTDVEALEHTPNHEEQLLAVTGFGPAPSRTDPAAARNTEFFPKFTWTLAPYLRQSYFDPRNPFRFGTGLRLSASYEPLPGLVFAGSIAKRLAGNIANDTVRVGTNLPPVRTDQLDYDQQGDPALEYLTASYYFKPGKNLYGRITGGYLERMFGGVSGEILWRPVDSRLALGAELNYVKQRDYETRFGFQDYSVVTGHLSAYYQLNGGFHAQLDVGRYLAGDVGATLAIDREFANGWSIGAFATLTNVSAEDFGEGSFDKGIRLKIPVSWFLGTPNTYQLGSTIRPIQRDGGARLDVEGRLYERVRQYQRPALQEDWGRVWR